MIAVRTMSGVCADCHVLLAAAGGFLVSDLEIDFRHLPRGSTATLCDRHFGELELALETPATIGSLMRCDRCSTRSAELRRIVLPIRLDNLPPGVRALLCRSCELELEAAIAAQPRCRICGTCECRHGTDFISASHRFEAEVA